jgi:transposase InsO family protein
VGLIRFRGHPALRVWVRRAQADRTHGRTGLTTVEREELSRLRKESRARTERDILKKDRPSSRSTRRKVCLDRGGEGQRRRHSTLGQISPAEFERRFDAA